MIVVTFKVLFGVLSEASWILWRFIVVWVHFVVVIQTLLGSSIELTGTGMGRKLDYQKTICFQ